MYQESFIDSLSIFFILALIFAAILLMFELGYRQAQLFLPNKINKTISPMATGLASLLAFILAITFSMAAAKNGNRKQLVLDEANAVGTALLRSELLDEPYRNQSKALLKEYVNIRVVEDRSQRKAKVNQVIIRSEEIHQELWQLAAASHHAAPSGKSRLYLESLNEVFDIHTKRVNINLRGRIPLSIWFTLGLLTFLTVALNGIQVGSQGQDRTLIAALPFALAFSLVLTLIVELDRPARSIIDVSQQALIDLRDSIN